MHRMAVLVLAVAFGIGLLLLAQDERRGVKLGTVLTRWRPPSRPTPRSLDDIFRLQGDELLGALMERTALRAERAGLDSLSPSEAALLDVGVLRAEVNNGGFDQYFHNSSGDRARGALAGLELIGAEHTAAILRRAMATFGPQGPASSRKARWEQMDQWKPEVEATLDALDRKFYASPEPIAGLMERHCRAHREAFAP